jgi:hypothetical protein
MSFLRGRRATSTLEWIVIAALLILVLAPTFLGLFDAIKGKLQAIKDGL